MAIALRLVVNPANTAQYYILWDNGRIQEGGGAIPITGTPTFFNTVPPAQGVGLGPARALCVTDWTTPSGYFLDWQGTVTAFGSATAPASQAGSAPAPYAQIAVPFVVFDQPAAIAVDMVVNPVANGQGYILVMDGSVRQFGGAPALATWPPDFPLGTNGEWAFRIQMEWATKRYYVLTTYGRTLARRGDVLTPPAMGMLNGQGYNGEIYGIRWPFEHANDFSIYDWANGYGWALSEWGGVYAYNGAQYAGTNQGGNYWLGQPIARALAILDTGLGANPLTIETLTQYGGGYIWFASVAPTVALNGPTGTVTDGTRPLVSWNYANTYGDAQASWIVRIFSNAQKIIGGFDPASSPYTVQITGTGTDASVRIPAEYPLANGTWWAYIQVTSTAGMSSTWGAADSFGSWVQNVTIPPTPTVTATPGADELAGISLLVHTAGAPGAGVYFGVQWRDSDDTNGEWRWVHDGEQLTPDGGFNATVVDFEARYGVARDYRALAYKVPTDQIIASGFGTTSATLDKRTVWTLIDPLDYPSGGIVHLAPDVDWSEPVDATAFQPDGQRDAIVMVDSAPVKGFTTAITLLLPNATHYDLIRPLLVGGTTLLLRDPYGRAWYLAVASERGGEVQWTLVDAAPEECTDEDQPSGAGFYHQVQFPVVQVARPSDADTVLDSLLA